MFQAGNRAKFIASELHNPALALIKQFPNKKEGNVSARSVGYIIITLTRSRVRQLSNQILQDSNQIEEYKKRAHGERPQLSLWCSKQLLCELYLSIVSDWTCSSVTASHRRSSLGGTECAVRVAGPILGGPLDCWLTVTQLRDIPERGYV